MEEKKQNQVASVEQRNICENVMVKIQSFQEHGSLKLPGDYSAENSLRAAWLILQDVVDKDKKPVLESCTKESIANALLKMTVRGLNPMKNQGYFIPYGKKLAWQDSYLGKISLAKRIGMKWINANIIFEGDVFETKIDINTGRRSVIKHEQDFLNIDLTKIKGCYAVYEMESGEVNVEIMNMMQIKKAWMQGQGLGQADAHKNFTDQMCKKTVINRVCSAIINSSDDSYLYDKDTEENDEPQPDISQLANQKQIPSTEINIEDAEVVETKQLSETIEEVIPDPVIEEKPKEVAKKVEKKF